MTTAVKDTIISSAIVVQFAAGVTSLFRIPFMDKSQAGFWVLSFFSMILLFWLISDVEEGFFQGKRDAVGMSSLAFCIIISIIGVALVECPCDYDKHQESTYTEVKVDRWNKPGK